METQPDPALVLFDVDETLVHTGGAGARSWTRAFQKLYGVAADIGDHSSAGETDPEVARATFRGVLNREPHKAELALLYAEYLSAISEEIYSSTDYHVLAGARTTLETLRARGVLLGIVSGAMEGSARIKLTPANLNRFFLFGGYGTDSDVRDELVLTAISRARRLQEIPTTQMVYIVGDTPHDIAAARAAGAVSVAVASGHFTVDQLTAAGADYVLESLQEPFPTHISA